MPVAGGKTDQVLDQARAGVMLVFVYEYTGFGITHRTWKMLTG